MQKGLKIFLLFIIIIVIGGVITTYFYFNHVPSKFLQDTPTDQKMKDKDGCKVGGCSGQLCVEEREEGIVTTCEWREEYACYKTAKCERQADGKCGWTKTDELNRCLEEKRGSPSDTVVF